MEEKTSIVYVAFDGKEFTKKQECESYEKEIKSMQLWRVIHSPDCTEGRGYYGCTYLNTKNASKEEVEDFCFEEFGKKSAYVMGVSFVRNWILTLVEDKENHIKKGASCALSVGKYSEITLEHKRGNGLFKV